MIGVGKLHLASDILQIFGAESALDGTLGAHVHKDRSLDRAVGAGKFAPAGLSFRFFQFKHIVSPSKLHVLFCELPNGILIHPGLLVHSVSVIAAGQNEHGGGLGVAFLDYGQNRFQTFVASGCDHQGILAVTDGLTPVKVLRVS